ncbi:MAG: UDP-N-acetylglucosamine--N-acetylmuramyl-(pentapeptide) pyrophosphoryl-undecaprenol N-acetylglucosamine transferase [Synergistaceae bacterium]|nr:UDP-N-acetylglucosamine--N-acetylmuramyl-(pentapeptide) pyrophosphoryl-undecaprenol N-acetylglucosamine transferase [Synergistaceae bacterium]
MKMTMQNNRRILIASGGTGGHIFPAIVFGRKLQEQGASVTWLCGSRELEREIYTASGIEPVILPLSGSPMGTRSIAKIFSRILDVFRSLSRTAKCIKSFNPDEVYLFGGYISFAPLVVAKLKGIPVTLHEQNTVAGRVARIAARMGAKIITGWPVCEGIKSFTYTGIPVREPVRLPRDEALRRLGVNVPEGSKIVGVAGGSLGSGPLSEILRTAAKLCPEREFVFLSSKERHDEGNAHFIPSQWDMNPFYSVCDVLVCRSGGSTLAEALKWGMPTITIPWPGAMDNHQVKNAQEFVKLAGNSYTFREDDSPQNLAALIMKM